MSVVFQIDNVEEYGKLVAYCIEKDISVFRSYWTASEPRFYRIDFVAKRLYYGAQRYWLSEGYRVVKPTFILDKFGSYREVVYE